MAGPLTGPGPRPAGDLQDGMLAHYLEQAKASDVNVEARIAKEPFDFRKDPFHMYGVSRPPFLGVIRAHRRKLVNP